MRVASGTELRDEGPRAGRCRDGLKAELWMIRPPVGSPSGQQGEAGAARAASQEGMNVRTATAATAGGTTMASHKAGGVTGPGPEFREKCGIGWNAERGSG
jgi:hypothetical protein